MSRDEFLYTMRGLIRNEKNVHDLSDTFDCEMGESFIGDLINTCGDLLVMVVAKRDLENEEYNKFWNMICNSETADEEILEFYDNIVG